MEATNPKSVQQNVTSSSDTVRDLQKENPLSNVSSQKCPENAGNKDSDVPSTAAPDKAAVKKDMDDVVSDGDIFEDALDDITGLQGTEVKIPTKITTEKYFSDIESSDDSQGYEISPVTGCSVPDKKAYVEPIETGENSVSSKGSMTSSKSADLTVIIELELEPVESEEEYFEELPGQEELPTVTDSADSLPSATRSLSVNEAEEIEIDSWFDEESYDADVILDVAESSVLSQASLEEEHVTKDLEKKEVSSSKKGESELAKVSSPTIEDETAEGKDQESETDETLQDSIDKTMTDDLEALSSSNEPPVSPKKDQEESSESTTNFPDATDYDSKNEAATTPPKDQEVDIDVPVAEKVEGEKTATNGMEIERADTAEVEKQSEEKICKSKEPVDLLQSPTPPDAKEDAAAEDKKFLVAADEKDADGDTTESENRESLEKIEINAPTGDEKPFEEAQTSLETGEKPLENLSECEKPLESEEKDLNSTVESAKSPKAPKESKEKENDAIGSEKQPESKEISIEDIEESLLTLEILLGSASALASEKSAENTKAPTEQEVPEAKLSDEITLETPAKSDQQSEEMSVDSTSEDNAKEQAKMIDISETVQEEKEMDQTVEKSINTATATDALDTVVDAGTVLDGVPLQDSVPEPDTPTVVDDGTVLDSGTVLDTGSVVDVGAALGSDSVLDAVAVLDTDRVLDAGIVLDAGTVLDACSVLDAPPEVESVTKETEKSVTSKPDAIEIEVETKKEEGVKADEPPKENVEADDDLSQKSDQAVQQKEESDGSKSATETEITAKANPPENYEETTKVVEVKEDKVEKTSQKPDEPETILTASPEDVEMLEIVEASDTEETTSEEIKSKFDAATKDDTTMKSADSGSEHGHISDDDEPLLVIDTTYKADNEDNDMDTETEQTATSAQTTDSSSDGSLEAFYEKECVNYECKHVCKRYFRATMFTLSYYKITKKRSKAQFVCEECYDRALDSYEDLCATLNQKQPLLLSASINQLAKEFVEIIDSSDEDESDGNADKSKDENALPQESIQLLEAELEGAIRKVMHNVEIQNQLSWTKQILQQRLNNLEEDTEFVNEQLQRLQNKADSMHTALYQCPKIKIRKLTPLDLNSGRPFAETESSVPPVGEVIRETIRIDDTYYAVKNKVIASWIPCKVVEIMDGSVPHSKHPKHYKIKFLKSKYPMLKTVSAKHMAFFNPPKVRLPTGTRVIAYYDASPLMKGSKEKVVIPSAFYPGIVAESLKSENLYRYLVFYDDGYFQYVPHRDVRLVCHASENVWDDVHHQSREFIRSYLKHFLFNRPMVQTEKGHTMLVDYNGKWVYSRVIDVDCSLVHMLFEGCNRTEWIYRGSSRLGPVYRAKNELFSTNPMSTSRTRRSEPFVSYVNGDNNSALQEPPPPTNSQPPPVKHQLMPPKPQPKSAEVRSVAKKSVSRTDTATTSKAVPAVRHLNNSVIFVDDDYKPRGKVVYYTAKKNRPPRKYVSHICSSSCPYPATHNLSFYSPLAKPLLSGWERQVFRQKSKKFIVYRGPCGKRLRSMEELHRYLRVTENTLNVDNFDFSPETNCLAEYVIESSIVQKKDISNGKEKMPIPCVNYYDNSMPPDCIYSSRRIPTEGVPLNLDSEFLVGCDCEDDCSDKTKCSCWELTYAGAKYGMPNVPHEMVGYQYKRLYEHVPTGIYECNSRCKCKANCINRVVQQPLQSKLQVFKTSNRGWGLRCINDVPRGSFICIYAGHLLTEQKANEGGLDAGDEYFAELDYIEVAEQIKEGYESDVVEPDEDEELYQPDKDDDDEFVGPGESSRNKSFTTRLRTRRSTKNSSDVDHISQERQVINFEPNKKMGQPNNSTEKQTIRKMFGKDEACYVMDAKVTGNLGRYFNHSCSPNLFVQNVFVDTHDLRFPWVAFFAFTSIRAGTELTWNYNYEVGVVPGKVLYCQCGAPNCRQRLL